MSVLTHTTKGFVLGSLKTGEYDRTLSVFTERFGKIRVLAKSVRKTNSKLKSGTIPYRFGLFTIIEGQRYILKDYSPIYKSELNIWLERENFFWYVRFLKFLDRVFPYDIKDPFTDLFTQTQIILYLLKNNDKNIARYIVLASVYFYLIKLGHIHHPGNHSLILLINRTIKDVGFRKKITKSIKNTLMV